MDFSKGDKCYIVVSNLRVEQVEIQNYEAGFYTIKFIDNGKVTRVKKHRLYSTYNEAENAIPIRADERIRRNSWGI